MIEAIKKRKSIREFQDKKVETEKIESILRAAMRAPSGLNGQPWEFIVVEEEEILQKMQNFSMGAHALKTAPLVIVILEREVLKRREMGITFLASQDLGACTENMWLQAVEEGLGASWMGVTPGSSGQIMLGEILQLPENIKAYAVMAVGYPAEHIDLKTADRFDQTRIHYNTYNK